MSNLKIISDFVDYYDVFGNNYGNIPYVRNNAGSIGRAKELKELRKVGVETVKLGQSRLMFSSSGYLMVYTEPNKHHLEGKRVMSTSEAQMLYPNSLASEFFPQKDMIGYKYLQIGKRRFMIVIKYNNYLSDFEVGKIEELESMYNPVLAEPIYSIDYINANGKMIACDYNKIENLERLCMNTVMNGEQVVDEIEMALIKYNKAVIKGDVSI